MIIFALYFIRYETVNRILQTKINKKKYTPLCVQNDVLCKTLNIPVSSFYLYYKFTGCNMS